MAIGWLAVLQSVPWSEVISNAPKLAEGAKKLWNTVAKNPPPPEPPATDMTPMVSVEAQALGQLETRVALAEETMSDLHSQMLASTELIKSLAEQNAQLIERIESNRVRVFWLAAATAVAVLAAGLSLALLVSQHGA
ncbi:MAG: hypothetical protein V4532_17030 [Pseudomonadota bacterium]